MSEPSQNPRNQRDQLQPFLGKKVQIGLLSLHYVTGWLDEFDGTRLHVRVNGKTLLVPREDVNQIAEAPHYQAEFFK